MRIYMNHVYTAEQASDDVVEFDLFVCCMQILGDDNPCFMLFQVDSELSCATSVEAEYDNKKRPLLAVEGFIR